MLQTGSVGFLFVCFCLVYLEMFLQSVTDCQLGLKEVELSLFSWKLIERLTQKIAQLVKCIYI